MRKTLSLQQVALRIIEIGKLLHNSNLISACDGNISCRYSGNRIVVTPSGVNKSRIKPGELALIRTDGKIIKGNPTSEVSMHLCVYKKCEAARCVIHAHPPVATAWSIAHPELRELPSDILPELILGVGTIPILPYTCPSTGEAVTALNSFLPDRRVFILAHHGAISWGENFEEALNGIERLEHAARVLKYAHELGGTSSLTSDDLKRLRSIREELGPQNR